MRTTSLWRKQSLIRALHDVSGEAFSRLGVERAAQYVVRPDGHVGYRCGGTDLRALERYLAPLIPAKNPPPDEQGGFATKRLPSGSLNIAHQPQNSSLLLEWEAAPTPSSAEQGASIDGQRQPR